MGLKGIILGVGFVVVSAAIAPLIVFGIPKGRDPHALMGDDFYKVRLDALKSFPRGSRIVDAASGLSDIGFLCHPLMHKMANINAESLICESHGRGYPNFPTLNVTIMGRNGLLSDIEVWNMLQRADAETPPPPVAPPPAAAPADHAEGEKGSS